MKGYLALILFMNSFAIAMETEQSKIIRLPNNIFGGAFGKEGVGSVSGGFIPSIETGFVSVLYRDASDVWPEDNMAYLSQVHNALTQNIPTEEVIDTENKADYAFKQACKGATESVYAMLAKQYIKPQALVQAIDAHKVGGLLFLLNDKVFRCDLKKRTQNAHICDIKDSGICWKRPLAWGTAWKHMNRKKLSIDHNITMAVVCSGQQSPIWASQLAIAMYLKNNKIEKESIPIHVSFNFKAWQNFKQPYVQARLKKEQELKESEQMEREQKQRAIEKEKTLQSDRKEVTYVPKEVLKNNFTRFRKWLNWCN